MNNFQYRTERNLKFFSIGSHRINFNTVLWYKPHSINVCDASFFYITYRDCAGCLESVTFATEEARDECIIKLDKMLEDNDLLVRI